MRVFVSAMLVSSSFLVLAESDWKRFAGLSGKSGWVCHVISPDPNDHGPDGINFHDWDKDGDLDLFVNYEEGKYSRLFFNPGAGGIRELWGEYLEFSHGKCEDSGIGDLDDDGLVDYVANGGWVYFNPGKSELKKTGSWAKMSLFDQEQRVPMVMD
ncbi:MAG: VCBS repeat-containing protein, partial [Verrucomicrobiota bacterium]